MRYLVTLLLLALASGACTPPTVHKYSYEDGWRHVEFIGLAADGVNDLPLAIDCRQDPQELSPLAGDGRRTYIVVKKNKKNGRWFHTDEYWVVAAENAQQLKAGDTLYANPKDCRALAAPLDGLQPVQKN